MREKIAALYHRYREVIRYIFFGGLTTVVNYVIYYAVLHSFGEHYLTAQVISWVGAVIFAYVTNKLFVFESRGGGAKLLLWEAVSFVAARLFSLGAETLLLWIQVDVWNLSEDFAKIPASVVTVVLNYVTGKLIVFAKKK